MTALSEFCGTWVPHEESKTPIRRKHADPDANLTPGGHTLTAS
jgi:hypothetical protein